jgi:hypothetical protein
VISCNRVPLPIPLYGSFFLRILGGGVRWGVVGLMPHQVGGVVLHMALLRVVVTTTVVAYTPVVLILGRLLQAAEWTGI